MLPTINLQPTELTQFDTSEGGFTPDADAEPTAMFSDVLALKTEGAGEAGDPLPATGNGLPLLPDALAADPELTADMVLEAGEPIATLPEDVLTAIDAELAPPSIVDAPEVVAVTPDVQPVAGPADDLSTAEVPPVVLDVQLSVEGLQGKEAQPATPPGPVEPGRQDEIPNLRPPVEAAGALLRDAAPQTGADASLRPILASAAPRNAIAPEVAPTRIGKPGTSVPVTAPGFDAAATRASEPQTPVITDRVPSSPETLRPMLEPVSQTVQAAQTNVLNAAGIADGAVDARASGDVTALARTATEPLAPRQLQTITQPIDTPVQQPDWDRAVSERIVMMANNKLQQADIRLTPAELGPLRVQVTVDDGATNVTFQAQHAMTREAIEQALPRLRELFSENGLSLGQTSVGQEGAAEGDDTRSSGLEASSGEGNELLVDEAEAEVVRTRVESGLVDTFV